MKHYDYLTIGSGLFGTTFSAKQPHVTFGGRLAEYKYYDMD